MIRKIHIKKSVLALMTLFVVMSTVGSVHAEGARGPGGVIRLEEITIEGRVQKPNAFYVLQRSSLGFEQSQGEQSFVREIVESVNDDPF
jgi:hypothetical protein